MYILDVMETCNSSFLASFLSVIKTIMLIIQFAVPFALIVSFTIDFVKLSINPEAKDSFRKLLNKIMAAVIVFVLPLLINVIMGVVGESTDFSSCWNNAPTGINIWNGGEYVPTDDENSVLPNDATRNDKKIPQKIVNE